MTPTNFHNVTAQLLPRVTREMNVSLINNISDQEIRSAVFAINPSKAPEEDSMTSHFFQKY